MKNKNDNFFIIECQKNDHIVQHNGCINVDKKYLDTFSSKKMKLYKGIIKVIF